jgi:hypothetical protein
MGREPWGDIIYGTTQDNVFEYGVGDFQGSFVSSQHIRCVRSTI